jgi:arsenate reductase-like glutaredoxin family protein
MKDGCKGDGSCGRREIGECEGECVHEHHSTHNPRSKKIDLKSLGPEATELAQMFNEINDHLISALKTRKKILEKLHKHAADSPKMKEKIDKVLASRHPVLLQFVFGEGSSR